MVFTPSFASVSLGKCALIGHAFVPIKLNASVSFPASRHKVCEDDVVPPTVESWAPHPVTSDASQLVLSLRRFIGEGRIGMTYIARVESASDASGADVSNTLPSEVCIKVAKPTFSRSLAREAWFYEQLGDCRGTSTAKCYGFFTVALSECKDSEGNAVTNIYPWKTSKVPPEVDSDMDDDVPSQDHLVDDIRPEEFTDEHGFKTNSSWNSWCPSISPQTVAILVLERLGGQYYGQGREPAAHVANLRSELSEVVHDIASTGIIHHNITAFNILRAPKESTETCPRHNYVHNWRLIDFDRSLRIDLENCSNNDINAIKLQHTYIGAEYSFWGSGE